MSFTEATSCHIDVIYEYFQEIIEHIRSTSHSAAYASSMSAPCAQQIMSSMKIIMGEDGTDDGK